MSPEFQRMMWYSHSILKSDSSMWLIFSWCLNGLIPSTRQKLRESIFLWLRLGHHSSLKVEAYQYQTQFLSLFEHLVPEIVSYTHAFQEIRVDDDFVKLLTRPQKFYIYFVSTEDQKVKHQLALNYSSILMDKEKPRVLNFRKLKAIELLFFFVAFSLSSSRTRAPSPRLILWSLSLPQIRNCSLLNISTSWILFNLPSLGPKISLRKQMLGVNISQFMSEQNSLMALK